MIHGDPGFDVFAMDVSRFGDWASMAYTNKKVQENYSRRFSIRFPNEELPAARPLKTTPIYDLLKAQGAQFGASWGLEAALWYAPEGVKDEFSWYRSTDFDHVGAEARAVRDSVGIIEISGFAKYSVRGEGARAWLDKMLACRIPEEGRMTLAPMLKHDGKVIGDFSLANLGDGEFFIAGSGVAEDYHMRWFLQHLPEDGSVEVVAHGAGLCGLSIAGPNARKVLEKVTDFDVSAEAFKFMDIAEMDIGLGTCLVGRVSFTGDLGYEIWVEPEYQRHIYQALLEAGSEFGIRHFGLRALNALRLEKNFGGWAREYRPIYNAHEAGLGRFVSLKKEADFIGKAAAAEQKDAGGRKLMSFVVDAKNADCIGDEPVWKDGKVVGWITSGGYAHASGVSVAMGYVPGDLADQDAGWQIELLGDMLDARPQRQPLFDANGQAMRA
jgi:dimethylglycine dehydrogenase